MPLRPSPRVRIRRVPPKLRLGERARMTIMLVTLSVAVRRIRRMSLSGTERTPRVPRADSS